MSFVPKSFRVLRHRQLRLVVLGNLVSNLGTWSQYVGVGWAVKLLTDSNAAIGLAFAAPLAASLFLSPFAGVIADRFDRRRLVMIGNVAMAVPPFLVGILLMRDAASVTTIILLITVGGIAQALTAPASLAIVPQLVPLEEVQQAVALNSGLTNATRIIGPGIGGFAILTWGVGWAFQLNAISFFAVVLAWAVVRIDVAASPPEVEPFGARLRAGFDYSRRNPTVGRLLLLTAVGAFCVMHAPLMPVIVDEVLHGDAGTYSLLSAAPGLGAFSGAMLAGEIIGARARRRTIAAGTIGMAMALMVLSLSTVVWLTAACLAVFGFGYFIVNALVTTAVVVASEEAYRGRVMGFLSMANAGIVPVNAVVAGLVASVIGPQWTVGIASTGLFLFATWFVATGKLAPVFASVPLTGPSVVAVAATPIMTDAADGLPHP